MSPDNGVRTIAEQSYKDAKKSDINYVTMSLVQLCGNHPDTRVRSFGAILLRDILKPLVSHYYNYCFIFQSKIILVRLVEKNDSSCFYNIYIYNKIMCYSMFLY